MICPICRGVIETAAESALECWLRHHVQRLRNGDLAHFIAMAAVPLMVWAAPKLRRAF